MFENSAIPSAILSPPSFTDGVWQSYIPADKSRQTNQVSRSKRQTRGTTGIVLTSNSNKQHTGTGISTLPGRIVESWHDSCSQFGSLNILSEPQISRAQRRLVYFFLLPFFPDEKLGYTIIARISRSFVKNDSKSGLKRIEKRKIEICNCSFESSNSNNIDLEEKEKKAYSTLSTKNRRSYFPNGKE